MPNTNQTPTVGDLRDFAARSFERLTGQSSVIASHYRSLSPSYLRRPMTPENVGDFVRRENQAILGARDRPTWQDQLAYFATPLRAPVAHLFSQNLVVGRLGHFADNDYAREALSHHTSGTF